MKVLDILNYNRILAAIVDNQDLKLDALVKFRFLGMQKQFEPIVANFEKIRNEKIAEFGEKEVDDDGNETGNISVKPENFETFNAELNKVANSDVEIELKKFKPDDIIDKGLPNEYLVALYDLIEE